MRLPRVCRDSQHRQGSCESFDMEDGNRSDSPVLKQRCQTQTTRLIRTCFEMQTTIQPITAVKYIPPRHRNARDIRRPNMVRWLGCIVAGKPTEIQSKTLYPVSIFRFSRPKITGPKHVSSIIRHNPFPCSNIFTDYNSVP